MEQTWPVSRVRKTFIEYFEKEHGHTFWRSSKVVPHEDPTLLFTNSGMNQFKPIFQGTVDPKSELGKLKRAANSQKCIRAGGKHNDLDDVGKDTYHHTFFEMLGNWSFGDYFKQEAIEWSWDLLVRVFGLDPSRLYATYYAGNAAAHVPVDEEARLKWLQYLPASRVLPFVKENFWEMGETGPCGPCTEIHYDLIGGRDASHLVNADDPTLIEIWNNVFMQFNREPDGSLTPLPATHVDTGMGLERIVCALQGKSSNYDTDVFLPIFAAIQAVTGVPAYGGRVDLSSPEGRLDMAYRVLADHTRCLAVALADGARPGPDGRDYVIRRILRRAIRYGMETMHAPAGFFAKLVDVVCDSLGDAFPEVREQRAETVRIIEEEEASFGRTLVRGSAKLGQLIDRLPEGTRLLNREQMFLLYDAFGFPADLTEIMANERGVAVDRLGFDEKMARKRAEDRLAGKSQLYSAEDSCAVLKPEARDALLQKKVPATSDEFKYTPTPLQATVVALWGKGKLQDSVRGTGASEDKFAMILDQTCFYAESGGQLGDMGVLRTPSVIFEVEDVQRDGPFVLHIGYLKTQGSVVSVGEKVNVEIDADRRGGLMRNHTGTHMLNHALRDVLGEGVEQKGSLVASDRMRFDYNSKDALQAAQISRVESGVLSLIAKKLPLSTQEVPLESALAIRGIRAVFGETYPNPVRVVSVGPSVAELVADPARDEWRAFPVELCGGTHLANSADARHFAVIRDDALARGVRRMVAVTGDEALRAVEEGERLSAEMARVESLGPAEKSEELKLFMRDLERATTPSAVAAGLWARVLAIQAESGKARVRDAKELRQRAADEGRARAERAKANGETVVVAHESWFPAQNPVLVDYLREIVKTGLPCLALAVGEDKKSLVVCNVPPELVGKLNATEWAKIPAAFLEGKAGGSKDGKMGQASGVPPTAPVSEILEASKAFALSSLGL